MESLTSAFSMYDLMQRNFSYSSLAGASNLLISSNGVIFVKSESLIVSQSPAGEQWVQNPNTRMLARWN